MKSVILFCVLVLAACLASAEMVPTNRLVNGTEGHRFQMMERIFHGKLASLGQFPWQVYITNNNPAGTVIECGGVLIHLSWVLTAAHCMKNATTFNIRLGSILKNSDGVLLTSNFFFIHQDYNKSPNVGNLNHDIALIKLPQKVTPTANIKVIQLVPNTLTVLNKLQVSGWGLTSDCDDSTTDTLNFANVAQASYLSCKNTYSDLTPQTMCTLGSRADLLQSTCEGDGGGPVVIPGSTPYLVAIASVSAIPCTQGTAVRHTRVVPYKTWISRRTGLVF